VLSPILTCHSSSENIQLRNHPLPPKNVFSHAYGGNSLLADGSSYARFKNTKAGFIALKIYANIEPVLLAYFDQAQSEKALVAQPRSPLAHPSISNEYLRDFLDRLRPGPEGREGVEKDLFDYLMTATNTEENIRRFRGN
jgi:hypothetical protein